MPDALLAHPGRVFAGTADICIIGAGCRGQELLPYVGHGWIRIKPDVWELQGRTVLFEDGTALPADATFPFLDPAVFAVRDGEAVELYRRMLVPNRTGLFFAGLVQPVGPTIPLVELQARWLAGMLSGRIRLPDEATMRQEIKRHRAGVAKRYVGSARYTLEVDFRSYAKSMARDAAKGMAGR